MFRKLIAALVPTMLFLLVAGPPQAVAFDAGTSALKPAKAKVSIEVWPKRGLFGYVKSPRRACEAGRLVRIFKKLPGNRLRAIGRDRTTKTDRGYLWSLKSRRATSGTVVASAPRSARCARDAARERIPVGSAIAPPCPSTADICQLERVKVSDNVTDEKQCLVWGNPFDSVCKSKLVEGRVPVCCFALGFTRWKTRGGRREVDVNFFDPIPFGEPSRPGPSFTGWVSDDRSPKFYINRFQIPGFEQNRYSWYTPEIEGVPPAVPGGPLHLNWDAGSGKGFDYYIQGYLYRNK